MDPITFQTARILSFSAHPDDEIGGAGGLLAKAAKQGAALKLVLCLDPVESRFDTSAESERAQRLAEFKAVGAALGAQTAYLGLPRFPLLNEQSLLPLVSEIRAFRPTLLLSPSDEERHFEHRLVVRLVRTANWQAGRAAFPDCGAPYRASELWQYEADNPLKDPTFLLDISEAVWDKRQLMEHYSSQVQRKKLGDAVEGLNRFRGLMYKTGTHAEAYKLIRLFYG